MDIDGPCQVCHGTGVVGEKCVCGRAADMTPNGYVRLGRYYCGRDGCKEIILEELAPRDKDEKDEDDFWRYRQNPWCLF